MHRLSVVIPNYNYGDFVGAAISSALAVDWPDVEVIVVDDGSTDHSREVISQFGDRVTIIEQDNAGALQAVNRGYRLSRGDVVIFLDSDDVLDPEIASEIAGVWYDGISKVQVQMRRIDREGRPTGSVFPEYGKVPTPMQIVRWMSKTSAYPTPPGSGNAYARSFLERMFPLDERTGRFSDSPLLAAAPYFGDVVTINKPLVGYRIHGNNDSELLADPKRQLALQVRRAYLRHLYALEIMGTGTNRGDLAPLFRSRHLLQLRIAERRTNPETPPPIPTDSRWRMLRDSFANLGAPGPESAWHRVTVGLWSIVTLISPPPLARRLIRARYSRSSISTRRLTADNG